MMMQARSGDACQFIGVFCIGSGTFCRGGGPVRIRTAGSCNVGAQALSVAMLRGVR